MRRAATLAATLLATITFQAFAYPQTDNRVDAIIAIARSQIMAAPDLALASGDKLRALAMSWQADRRQLVLANADWISAAALVNLNRPSEAIALSERGLTSITPLAPNSPIRGELLLARGSARSMLARIEEALRDYQNAYQIFAVAGDTRGQAIALQDIAVTYADAGDYKTALKYGRDSLQSYREADPKFLLSVHNNNGIALVQLQQYGPADAEYRLALQAAANIKNPLLTVRVLENLARSQADERDYAAADKTLATAFSLAKDAIAASRKPALYQVAAEVALRKNDIVGARRLIARASAGDKSARSPDQMRDLHRTAYEIYRRTGDDMAALSHLEAFRKLDDQARAIAASASAALMSARFDFANQDMKIVRLRAGQAERDATIARSRVRLHTIVTGGLLAAAALVSTLLAIGFTSIRRSRNQVRAANTSLQATNAELEKALAARTEFLATTSHEIRTPLNGILGMTQVILADRAVPKPLRERIELIQGSGETMRALVDDILDVAKMETGELRIHPVEMDLPKLLVDAGAMWRGQAETKQLVVELAIGDAPRSIVADEVRLRQIVFNLMSNAIKFTDAGSVTLTAKAQDGVGGERLVIEVADEGIGIPPDRLDEIFESFRQVDGGTTRRHGGTGLGLAICRSLARAMGGDVTVSSILGAGSTFTLDLPLERGATRAAVEQGAPAMCVSLAGAELLLVEANPLSQSIMRALIGPRVRGLKVVPDLETALETLDAGHTDHVVADGASIGLDVAAAGRVAATARAKGTRMSLLWPSPDAELRSKLAAGGVDQIISKPIAPAELLEMLGLLYDDVLSRGIAA